jgi:GTP-binding protein
MLPAVALVGRPNVGKSTLFNRLTDSRDALVADLPGVTRDRRYGFARAEGHNFLVIDTGGLVETGAAGVDALVAEQVETALEEASVVVLVTDFREGVTSEDERIAERLRRSGKPILLAVNKAEGVAADLAEADFHSLGVGAPVAVAAKHGYGVGRLAGALGWLFGPSDEEPQSFDGAPKLAVVGRPNVGKSTLINRLIGANRLVTSPVPGTTRDSILVPCEREGESFVLIDTAGMRRRARVHEAVEKYSIVQSLQALNDAGVAIVLLDAREGVTDQDLHLVGLVVGQGRALVIGVNKWDGLGVRQRRQVELQVERKLDFVAYATVRYISAKHGSGISELVRAALEANAAAGASLATPRLNEVLQQAIAAHPPPIVRGRQVRLRYAHQGGRYPPVIVVHGGQAQRLPAHYVRYLERSFRDAFALRGTPIRIELKSGDNPFSGRRNELTPRQKRRRKRLIAHHRRRR